MSGGPEPSAFGADSLVALLGHRYDQLELIDGRSTSLVYRARQISTDRQVAIKLMLDRRSRPGAPLPIESQALARLSWHSNVITLIETDLTSDGIPVLVTEYASSGTVEALAERGPLDVDRALGLLSQVASALAAAHRLGIVHCDLKPSNILLADDGTARLSDFGIARLLDATAPTLDDIRGTLRYVAPEVLDGAPPTAAADVYGLAITAWTLLEASPTDSPSGDLLNAVATQMQRTRPTFDRLRRLRPGSRRLEDLLVRATSTDAAERPSMAELAAAVDEARYAGGDRAGGRAAPVARRAATDRSWWRVAAVAVLVAAIGGVGYSIGSEHVDNTGPAPDGTVQQFCVEWSIGARRELELIEGLAGEIQTAPSAYDVAYLGVVGTPQRFSDDFARTIAAAARLGPTRSDALQLTPSALHDIVLANGIYALTRLNFLISPGEEIDREQVPLVIRQPTLAWDSLTRFATRHCAPPPPGATARLRKATAAVGIALRTRLDDDGLADFFHDSRSYGLFTQRSMLMMLELAPDYVDRTFPHHSDWFATLGEKRPDLRRLVFAQDPEIILRIAAEAPSFEETLLQVHPDWLVDLAREFKEQDMEPAERDRILTSYAKVIRQLRLPISQSTEGG